MRLQLPSVLPPVTVLAIDSGTSRLGYAVLGIDAVTLALCYIDAATLHSNQLLGEAPATMPVHGARFERVLAQQRELMRLFRHYAPNAVCCESAFYNPAAPNAFAALTEMLFAIKLVCVAYDPTLALQFYEPSTIKRAIGLRHSHKKEGVAPALKENQEIQTRLRVAFDALDNNAHDAIAVGYTHLLTLRGLL